MVDVIELLQEVRQRLNVVLVNHPVDAVDLQGRRKRFLDECWFLAPDPRSHCALPGKQPGWSAEE